MSLTAAKRGDFERSLDWAERAGGIPKSQHRATALAVVALVHLGRTDEARRKMQRLLAERPEFTHAFAVKKLFYLKRPEQLQLYLDGLDKAGVPSG